ncbi:MAG: hypothetical protein F6K54_05510 [Okeania sp. SIO3B5]|uniref:hypothetical protein n=1 Tax=Okeania sp. SIO3B5 TaxID=2607811 RepID=UPI0013FF0B11|nr:hypothetical protein [Okeania sp. SIO3B5]NEO52576.1 hypothetical protein [Okeania sp. SIO3B5]
MFYRWFLLPSILTIINAVERFCQGTRANIFVAKISTNTTVERYTKNVDNAGGRYGHKD